MYTHCFHLHSVIVNDTFDDVITTPGHYLTTYSYIYIVKLIIKLII